MIFYRDFSDQEVNSLRSKKLPYVIPDFEVLGESWTLEKLRATPLFENITSNKLKLDWFQIQDIMRYIQGKKAAKITILHKR